MTSAEPEKIAAAVLFSKSGRPILAKGKEK